MKLNVFLPVASLCILTFALCIFSTGCGREFPPSKPSVSTEESVSVPHFESLGRFDTGSDYFTLYRDPVTDLLYLSYRYKDGYAGGASLLPYYYSDGSHMTYSRYLSLCEGGDK